MKRRRRLPHPADQPAEAVGPMAARLVRDLTNPPPGRPRLVLRGGRLGVTYRSRLWSLLVMALVVAVLITVAALTGLMLAGTVVCALLVLAWTASTVLSLRGFALPQPGGAGPQPPDSHVREPRRPGPFSPAGAAAPGGRRAS